MRDGRSQLVFRGIAIAKLVTEAEEAREAITAGVGCPVLSK
jgi:hypothetical protein